MKILHLEADAAEMCAAQYEQIPIASGLRNYKKHRDAYRRYASHLRSLAQQNPKTLPPEVGKGRQVLDSIAIQSLSSQQKTDAILQSANSDTRGQSRFKGSARRSRVCVISGVCMDSTFLQSRPREYRRRNY